MLPDSRARRGGRPEFVGASVSLASSTTPAGVAARRGSRKFPKHRRPAATSQARGKYARIRIESAALPEMEFGRSRQSGRPRRSGASLRATFARVACREASGIFRCGGVRRARPSREARRYRTWHPAGSLSHMAPQAGRRRRLLIGFAASLAQTTNADRFIVKLDHPIRAGPPRAGAGQLQRS